MTSNIGVSRRLCRECIATIWVAYTAAGLGGKPYACTDNGTITVFSGYASFIDVPTHVLAALPITNISSTSSIVEATA